MKKLVLASLVLSLGLLGCRKSGTSAGDTAAIGAAPVAGHTYEINVTNVSQTLPGSNLVQISLFQPDPTGNPGPLLINNQSKDYLQTAAYVAQPQMFGQRFTVQVRNGDKVSPEFQGRVRVTVRDTTTNAVTGPLTADEFVTVHGKGPGAEAAQDFVLRLSR